MDLDNKSGDLFVHIRDDQCHIILVVGTLRCDVGR